MANKRSESALRLEAAIVVRPIMVVLPKDKQQGINGGFPRTAI
jgi:hypothetical protein